jgi:hypothetical protein
VIGESTPIQVADRTVLVTARSGLRRRRFTIGALLIATLVSIVAAEVMIAALPAGLKPTPLRTIETFYTRRAQWQAMTAGDSYLGFKLRPDVDMRFPFEGGAIPIRTTSHGLGGTIGFRDIGTHAPFGAIVIGDSYAFCDEVVADDCWVRRLSDRSGISLATLGVSGYSTMAEARMLKRYGASFGAPLVLVGVFPNDLADNVNFGNWSGDGSDDMTLWLQRKRAWHPVGPWLEQHSALYRLAGAALHKRTRGIHRHRENGLDLVLRFDDWWLKAVKTPERHPGWPLMKDALLDMKQTAGAMGAKLAVVVFPTKEEAYFDIARRYLPALDAADADRLPRLVTSFLTEQGILGCDVSGELRAQARQGRQLYYSVSGHFNQEGNHVAADAVQRCLAAHGLLRPQSLHATR